MVILSEKCGLIEWVPNTKGLRQGPTRVDALGLRQSRLPRLCHRRLVEVQEGSATEPERGEGPPRSEQGRMAATWAELWPWSGLRPCAQACVVPLRFLPCWPGSLRDLHPAGAPAEPSDPAQAVCHACTLHGPDEQTPCGIAADGLPAPATPPSGLRSAPSSASRRWENNSSLA